ncbi:MAG: hypothetical protein COA73_13365 [Candidatus Hydrogenedentota bacterium]|nr:MAG: hypothetical protein COA73_13365 [Candidatus Hydrogenedentota bacterium]
MDKKLITNQLNIIKNLPPGQFHDFTLEGAAALKAFVASRENIPNISPVEKALHEKIRIVLRTWESTESTPKATSQAPGQQARTQLALREVIDKAQQGRIDEISKDELKLLRGAHEAYSERVANGAASDTRLRDLLESMLKKIADYKFSHNCSTDDSVFSSFQDNDGDITEDVIKNAIIALEDFGDIHRSPLSILEEVGVDLNVRVFEYTGHTTIEGDIPQDVLVRVTDGNITVNGFVTGAIVASGNITIEGNVQQGILISNEGDIAVQQVLIGSSIIAKKGNAVCHHLEAPSIAFAWNSFSVEGPMLGGKLSAGTIDIKEKTVGAELHSCGKIAAESIQTGSKNPTVICLRNSLTCVDYGRIMDDINTQRQKDVKEFTEKIVIAQEMDRLTHHLIQNCYRTSLFYLLGGLENTSTAMSLQGLQLKSLNLRQIISLAESSIKFFQTAYDDPDQISMEKIMEVNKETIDNIGIINQDIETLPDDFGSTHKRYLLDRCTELISMLKQLHKQYEASNRTDFLQNTVIKTISEWRGILGDTDREIRDIISMFGLEDAVLNRINDESESLEDMVNDTVKKKLASPDQREKQRAESPIIRLLCKSAERYARNIKENHNRVVEARESLKEIRKELTDNAVIQFGESTPGSCLVKSGHYDSQTVITTSPKDRNGKDTNMAKVIVIDNTVDESTEFWLREQLIQKVV